MEFSERLKEQRAQGKPAKNLLHQLDDGTLDDNDTPESSGKKSKKKQKNKAEANKEEVLKSLKMEPGESWTDFNRRVNEALPLVHAKKAKKNIDGLDLKGNKKGKNGQQKDDEEQEFEGEVAEQEDEIDSQGRLKNPHKKNGRKRERSPDPWAHLEKKKEKPKFGEVADAPPDLRLPSKLLSSIPKNAGSMAKRYMLQQEREKFIEGYRALMESKKTEGSDI